MPVLNYGLAIPKVEKRCVSGLQNSSKFSCPCFFPMTKKSNVIEYFTTKSLKTTGFSLTCCIFTSYFFILGLRSGLSSRVQKRCGSVLYPWHNSNSKQQKWQFFGWFRKRFGKTHGTGCYWFLPRRNQRTWSQRSRHLQNFRRRNRVQRTVGKNCLRQWTYA